MTIDFSIFLLSRDAFSSFEAKFDAFRESPNTRNVKRFHVPTPRLSTFILSLIVDVYMTAARTCSGQFIVHARNGRDCCFYLY